MLLQTLIKEKKRGGKRNELPKTFYLFLHPSLRHKSVTANSEQSDPNPEESHKNELKKESTKKRQAPVPYIHTYINTYIRYIPSSPDACKTKSERATSATLVRAKLVKQPIDHQFVLPLATPPCS
jgi:hypothetical protein